MFGVIEQTCAMCFKHETYLLISLSFNFWEM